MTIKEQAIKAANRLENQILIDGKLLSPKSKEKFPVISSATNEIIGYAPECNEQDIELAVESAIRAQKLWKKIHPRERGKLLQACALELEKHKDELTYILTLETSKSIRTESRLEVNNYTDIFHFYAGLGSEIKGETVPLNMNMLTYTIREPLGVVAGIIPWNVPLLLMALKIAPAIMSGNAIIIKSSENAPFAVLRVCEIMNQILPKGIFNMISGVGASAGNLLVKHPKINKISFTGSVQTGKKIFADAANKIIPLTFELGGKSPMIICDDADFDEALEGAVFGMRYTRQGQSCSAASRIYVHDSIYNKFIASLSEKLDKLVIGDPFDEKTDIGAIISKKQYDTVNAYLELASNSNAIKKIICGKLPSDPKLKDGLFLQPTLLTEIENDHKLVREEIFGPLCCIQKWNDFDKVLDMANDSSYGLTASIWTKDLNKALRAVNEIEAGLVQVNQCALVQANLPYGGFKNSGIGQEATKESMLEHFTHRKTVIMKIS